MNFAGNTRLKDYISMKKFFNIIPGEDACCILLYGDIGDYDGNVRSGDIARELLEAEALSGRIDVRINSNGGEVYAGIAIFNALKNSKADITIYVDGIAASMASVIALCGKPVQMSRYARLMLHSVQGGCYGNKEEMRGCIREIESLEDTLCEMYAARMGKDKEEIRSLYFDGKDHWLRADEALALGLIDGIYDAAPLPEDSTPEQVFQIFNNRLHKPQNKSNMNLDELKKRPRFKNCVTDDDFLREVGLLETEAGKVPGLDAEVTRLKGELKEFRDKADADEPPPVRNCLMTRRMTGVSTPPPAPSMRTFCPKDRETGKRRWRNSPRNVKS